MPRLIILRGVSGSGKSTWARNQPGNPVIVSRDDLRAALFGSDGPDYYQVPKDVLREREDFVSTIEQTAIKAALTSGKDVISDNTHTMMKYVNRVAKVGWAAGADVEIKVFDTPLDLAIQRVAGRAAAQGRDVPVEAIRRQYQQFQGSKNATLDTPPKVKPYSGTPGKPKAFLVDIDGTLAHLTNRSPYDWKRVGEDDVDEVISDIVRVLGSANFAMDLGHYTVVVMSGRDGSCRVETEEWLDRHDIIFDALFMRPAGDMRPDNIVKAELFDSYVRDNFDVRFVLDDRQQVVDMWRKMGLTCLQVAEGDF